MINNKTIISVVVYFIVLIATWSCTGNSETTGTREGDTTNMNNTTENTSPASGQTNATNESMTAGNGAVDNGMTTTSTTNTAAGDTAFLMKASEINLEEIKLGKLAQQKGTMPHVKELGKMMVTAHTQAMTDLAALAKTKTVTLPNTESEKIKADYKMLNAKNGKDFDKAYSDMMVNGHKEAIALFEKTNMDTKDAAIKTMTTSMIPNLKTHLEHAEMCKKECEKM